MPDFNLDASNQGTLEVGSFIGGTYRVLDFIGQGGMGFVYKVEHLMMAKVLALKVLRSEQVSEEVWKRFRIEAQAIARLDHANVVRIYDMSQTEAGLPYYTMDLLVGESLADYLDEYYRLPVKEALPIFRQVCAGLAYAHDRGIIHRDIKPGNIMLLRDGRENAPPVVKIVDFGIAKLSSFDSGFGQGLTRPGEVFGSPLYMSPEQCQGQPVDHRSDIYSLGCALFESIAGNPPFSGANAVEIMLMHTEVAMPKLADRFSEGPAIAVDSLIARMTAKEPGDRYQSMDEVAAAIARLQKRAPLLSLNLPEREDSARATGETDSSLVQSSTLISRVGTKWLIAGSILVVVALLGGGAYFYQASISAQPKPAPPSDLVTILEFGPIKSHPIGASGYKEIVFPSVAIGSVADVGSAKPRPAVGPVRVKDRRSVALLVDENEVPLTFESPQIFEQIGKEEFQSLYLKAKNSLAKIGGIDGHGPALDFDGLPRSERIAHSQKQLIAILKIVSTWPSLVNLTLDGFAPNAQVFQLLDELPQLRAITLKRANFSMKELTSCKLFNRLSSFSIEEPVDSFVDPLLLRLSQCEELTGIELDSVDFLPQSLSQLKRCPKLTTLNLNKTDISDEVVKIISRWKNLSTFRSEGKCLSESQIATLAKCKNLRVFLSAKNYSDQTDKEGRELLSVYRAKFPTIKFE